MQRNWWLTCCCWECEILYVFLTPLSSTNRQKNPKLNMNLTWPSKCTLRHLSQGNENYVHTKTWTWMLKAAFFEISPHSEQGTCLSMSEWSKQTVVYTYKGMWVNLQKIILQEKKVNSEILHIILFHLHCILEVIKL